MSKESLVLNEEIMKLIHNSLITLLKQSEAKCVVLVDQDGKCIAKRGFTQKIDTDALAALIAGAFSSTKAMAQVIGETDFSILFHQGQKDNIHNILVDDNTILSILFDDRTTIGMVRLYSKESARQLREVLKKAKRSKGAVDKGLAIDKEAEKRFDDIFDGKTDDK